MNIHFGFSYNGKNVFLIISTIILGIGHIGIHLNHRKEIKWIYQKVQKELSAIGHKKEWRVNENFNGNWKSR